MKFIILYIFIYYVKLCYFISTVFPFFQKNIQMTLITIMRPISRRSLEHYDKRNSRWSFSELFRNQLINLTGAHPHREREIERVGRARDGGGFLHKWNAMRIYDRDSSQRVSQVNEFVKANQ